MNFFSSQRPRKSPTAVTPTSRETLCVCPKLGTLSTGNDVNFDSRVEGGISNEFKSTTTEAYSLMERITSKTGLQFCTLRTANGYKCPAAYINRGIIMGGLKASLCFAEHQHNKPPHT